MASTEIPNIIKGPITESGIRDVIEREIWEAVIAFQDKSRNRVWLPENLPFNEMKDQGPKLSDDTVNLIEGFFGVEGFVGDYVIEGLKGLQNSPARVVLLLQWGAEEGKHWQTLQGALVHSGRRTQEEVDAYNDKNRTKHWQPSDHKGLNGPLGGAFFPAFQERGTYTNYILLDKRVRSECGLPQELTEEERKRKQAYGISEALLKIRLDEIAHHGIYLKIAKIHLAYRPEESWQSIREIFDGFKMPSLRKLAQASRFIRSLTETSFYNTEVDMRLSRIPTLRALGFEDRKDLDRAIQEAESKIPSDSLEPIMEL